MLTGCGGSDLAGVSGLVKLDGKPIEGGSVTFSPADQGALAYSSVNPDGTYELQSAGAKKGVKPGDYVATVSYRKGQPSSGMTIAQIEALELVPIRYTTPATSDLRVTVAEGDNEINLEMTK